MKEKIIEIIGFGIERERAELKADEIIKLYHGIEQKAKIFDKIESIILAIKANPKATFQEIGEMIFGYISFIPKTLIKK